LVVVFHNSVQAPGDFENTLSKSNSQQVAN